MQTSTAQTILNVTGLRKVNEARFFTIIKRAEYISKLQALALLDLDNMNAEFLPDDTPTVLTVGGVTHILSKVDDTFYKLTNTTTLRKQLKLVL